MTIRHALLALTLAACSDSGIVVDEEEAESVTIGVARFDCPAGDVTRDVWRVPRGAIYSVHLCSEGGCTPKVVIESGDAVDLRCDGTTNYDRWFRVRYIAPVDVGGSL